MEAERRYLKARAEREGPSRADYERHDTITSLTMGVASLVAPMVLPRLLAPFTPGKGKYGKALVASAIGSVAVTAIADRVARRTSKRKIERAARQVASVGSVASVVTGGVAITTTWASLFDADRMWKRRILPDLGKGAAGLTAAVFGWDFIYYWNHRFMHESRYMWAIHVVHHSSERYNLSTALRQPVADVLGTFAPYGLLCLFGVRPELVAPARGINLLYQYWIHTDTIRRLGPFEEVLNTPSHHRVHHGTNQEYLDRNHGSILIVWDRLFGTFQPERDPVVYGLTKNINTFNPGRVIAHEHADMLRDVGRAGSWKERLSFVVRGPGWAYQRHRELADIPKIP
jgi:sterol desaturase/sphingolipid hydroxylase (fatty acid hydroxylase superfamily)